MDTIAHYLDKDIKVNQDYKYRQITRLRNYRSIVIGEFAERNSEKEFPYQYYYKNDIKDWPKFIKENQIKAFHAHIGVSAVQLLPIALRYNVPLIVSFRGNDASARGKFLKENRKRYKELMKHGSLFLPVCGFFQKELVKLGFKKKKIKILYGGIDTGKFSFQKYKPNEDQSFRILSIGRMVQKKGFPDLIKAFRIVHHKFPKSKLIIIGRGESERGSKLLSLANEYHLNGAVEVKRELRNDLIVKELHRADLFCLPSRTTGKGAVEGIPNVLKEAMSCGTPVVSTFHAGIPELIDHNDCGLLVKEGDVKALADAMIHLLENPKKSEKFALRARKKVENEFNLEKQIAKQEQYYKELLKALRKNN